MARIMPIVRQNTQRDYPSNSKNYPLLLKTKLAIPALRTQMVARPRLYEQLDQILTFPFTLISAPAGFGKTTVMSAWIARTRTGSRMLSADITGQTDPICNTSIAWLSLDENDNDPRCFWQYFIAALETLDPGIGDDALALLFSAQPPSITSILTVLINEATTLTHDCIVVLDDYHLIDTQPIHDALAFLLSHLPTTHLHLVMISRADPPLPLARLRAQRQLHEIRTTDLCFTTTETMLFFNEVAHLDLTQEIITTLAARIEGWVVGLQLVALALHGQQDRTRFVASFTDEKHPHRYIVDYLLAEVLHRQPEQIQDFLLRTCILDILHAELCDALTEQSNSQETLTLLEQKNLFIVLLNEQQYRYHHLFTDVLRSALQQVSPELMPELHLKASRWYEQHQYRKEAIHHAIMAADFLRAATLIEQLVETTSWAQLETLTLRRWLESLPEAVLRPRPLLSILSAWILYASLQFTDQTLQTIEAHLYNAEQQLMIHPDHPQTSMLQGKIATLRASVFYIKGELPATRVIECAYEALALLPQEQTTFRALAARMLVNVYNHCGDTTAARQALKELIVISQTVHDKYSVLKALCSIAQLEACQGHLRQSFALFQRAIQLAGQKLQKVLPAMSYLGLGGILLEWNDVAVAEQHVMTAIAHASNGGDPAVLFDSYVVLASVKKVRGGINDAFAAIDDAEHVLQSRFSSQSLLGGAMCNYLAALRARLHLAQGDLDVVNRWVQACVPLDNEPVNNVRVLELTTLARAHLAYQQPAEALNILARLLVVAEETDRIDNLISLLTFQAVALSARGDKRQAISTLLRALSLAESGGYIRTFINEGVVIKPLLLAILDMLREGQPLPHKVSLNYVCTLLAALEHCEDQATLSSSTSHAVQTPVQCPSASLLSRRECEILRLMAQGLSDREIAQQLVLAESSVKTYAKRLYVKLDVKNRTQAVTRAFALRIL